MSEIIISFSPPAKAINMNDGGHWSKRAEKVAEWRKAGWVYGRNARAGRLGPSIVTVHLPVVGDRRRDPHNYAPTMKAIIDGLVDARLWPDDNADWVTTTEPVLVASAKLVRVVIRPRTPTVAAPAAHAG